jgi:hypothetical protein
MLRQLFASALFFVALGICGLSYVAAAGPATTAIIVAATVR